MKSEIILITGASGCVGQYTANWLIENSSSELFLWVRDPKKITSINLENPRIKVLVGDLRQSKHFDNVRLWMTALPFQKFTIKDNDVEGHWDGGSNSHLFTKREYFYVLQPITSQVTQVSGAKAVCEGIGIVIIHIPKTDIVVPLYLSLIHI